ncbi:sulfotransferase family protein [Cerasicoccus frondis]|uniref:sulfotransferase family protein n=1 Tax=Cerasicoccus frondis TaxID=490090 RepID=UPI0028526F29|nr:sulfotransferase [Cerasicoccus frondis]
MKSDKFGPPVATAEQQQAVANMLKKLQPAVVPHSFPNLLIIGPQCTGTTWVYRNLESHPQVMFSTEKEPHFFAEHSLMDFIDSGELPDLAAYQQMFARPFMKRVLGPKPFILAEATASYAWQPTYIIDAITSFKPDVKAIMLVRNPVEKLWSNFRRKMVDEGWYQSLDEVPEAVIEQFIQEPRQIYSASFTKMIANWKARLQPGHLFIGRFDDLSARPAELMRDIFQFLQIDGRIQVDEAVNKNKIRISSKMDLPEKYRNLLKQTFADELALLASEYGYSWE